MTKKITFILLLISISVSLCLISSTYSKYVADTTSNINILFAKWQILVNNSDITSKSSSDLEFTPVIIKNDHVASGVMAPASKGYFDITLDPSNVDVSFKYSINLSIDNDEVPDLIITEYAFLPDNYIEGNDLDTTPLNEYVITNELDFDNKTEDFTFKPFTIRVFFEWYEGKDELMDDEADSIVGNNAATNDTSIKITANIHFEQKIGSNNTENIENSTDNDENIIDNDTSGESNNTEEPIIDNEI